MTLTNILTNDQFEKFVKSAAVVVVHFYAPWAPQCKTMDDVIEELSKQDGYKNVAFGKCEAEDLSEIALTYKIKAVPTILLFKNGLQVETINGANAPELNIKLKEVTNGAVNCGGNNLPLNDRLKALVTKSPVMVFMKGNPEQPRCGFSRTLVGILNETGVPYETFDILENEDVRQGLKTYSNWPTYPQIYVKGELIGGLDIIQELKQAGELADTLQGVS